ncbi:MAG: phage/plasmid primase, P4 family [Gammaproteobacteria bacterium]
MTLPDQLAHLAGDRHWCWWRYETRDGSHTKVPYGARGRRAKSNDPSTWLTFAELPLGAADGPGIFLGDGLQGVDLDACLDAAGIVEPWAAEIVTRLGSYTEVSPSGRGLKVFFTGTADKSSEVSFGDPVALPDGTTKRRELALFVDRRFFTVTGQVFEDVPVRTVDADDIAFIKEKIEALRQAERDRKRQGANQHAAPIGAPAQTQAGKTTKPCRLPAWLRDLIEQGAPEGERSEKFYKAVRALQERGLDPAAIQSLLSAHPTGIAAKFIDRLGAEIERVLGKAPAAGVDNLEPMGYELSTSAPAYADFADPVAAAGSIIAAHYRHAGARILHYWQDEFHMWTGTHYVVLPLPDLRALAYRIGPACSEKPTTKPRVDNVVDALRGAANLSHLAVPCAPEWIERRPDDPDPRAMIPLANGLLNVDDGRLIPPTPRLFVPYALPFEHDPVVAAPATWLRFLAALWPDDQASVDCLQEWFGYLLTAATDQQKAMMVVGPKRSGKGTIGRIIVRLLGAGNVASPTLASLGQPFGLQVLIGKTAALISDARLGGRADIAAIAENLLRITGEDEISVDRKFQTAYTARLISRLIVLTNEVPVFRDAASALPSRFVILRTSRSFIGQEDHQLEHKLVAELPGILAWALAGLRRLRERGRFVQPEDGAAALRLMEDLASPIGAFLRERCVVEPGAQVPIRSLYEEWKAWCKDHGRDQPGTEQTFGRDIAAAAPHVRTTNRRVNSERHRYYEGLRIRTPDDEPEGEDDGEIF